MTQTSEQDPGKRFHAELTARLRCGLPRRWTGTVRPHVSAGQLTLGLSRRLADFRATLGSRARSRWCLSIPLLSLILLRRWQQRNGFRFLVQNPTVPPFLSFIASFRSHFALWAMSRTPASSLARESGFAPPESSHGTSGDSQKSAPPPQARHPLAIVPRFTSKVEVAVSTAHRRSVRASDDPDPSDAAPHESRPGWCRSWSCTI